MVTAQVTSPGAERAARQLKEVGRSLKQVGNEGRSLVSPLIGSNLVALLLGGSLLRLALSGGSATNSIVRLQSALEELFRPALRILDVFVDWFANQSRLTQGLIVFGAAALFAIGPITRLTRGLAALYGIAAVRLPLAALFGAAGLAAGKLALGVGLVAGALYLAATRSETFRRGFKDATNFMINRANDVLGILYAIGDVTAGVGASIGAIASGRNPITAFQNAQTGGLRDTGFRIPAYDIPDNRSGFRQPGQGLFSLTPFESQLFSRLGLGGGTSRTLEGPPTQEQAIINNYLGLPPGQVQDAFGYYSYDSGTQSRIQGGP